MRVKSLCPASIAILYLALTATGGSLNTDDRYKYSYVGCFIDQEEHRELNGHSQELGNDNSPVKCISLCKQKGYVYAGLQYRFDCFCGDKHPEPAKRADERECKHKCPPDIQFNCGGDERMNVYKTGNPDTLIIDKRFIYVGCFLDQEDHRELNGHSQELGDSNSPEKCITLCKQKGYVYAGLQYGFDCFCGDKEPAKRTDEHECKHKCPSAIQFNCGGDERMNVYKTGNPEALYIDKRYKYVGCFVDQEPTELNGYSEDLGKNNSPERCITLCRKRGYVYAGLQYINDCFCGDQDSKPIKQVDDRDCKDKCPGDIRFNCGGDFRINVYRTENPGNDDKVENVCTMSATKVNGKTACQNEVVFEDNFDSLSPENWNHIIQIAGKPDYQFVIYNSDPANAYAANGKLVIKPILLPDSEVTDGDLHLQNCTGKSDTEECGYKAKSYFILPPVQSACLTTSKSFRFRYGKVEISAKLPAGDWLVPEIWLEPKNEVYGPGYDSGRVCIAMSRGNNDLKLNRKDIGSKLLEIGVFVGVGDNVMNYTITKEIEDGWYNKYHKYSVIWTPENIIFMVDGGQPNAVVSNGNLTLSAVVGLTPDITTAWGSTSKIAPFDKDFYISVGISAGGSRNFPDNVINNGKPKPWKNRELKAMLNFWRDKGSWQPTWHDDTALLQVDYIKVTAL